jgi:hypothetical protein
MSVEDRDVLAERDLPYRLVQLSQIGIGRTTFHIVQLGARNVELSSKLHEGEDPPLGRRNTLRWASDGGDAAEIGRRVGPTVRSREVH